MVQLLRGGNEFNPARRRSASHAAIEVARSYRAQSRIAAIAGCLIPSQRSRDKNTVMDQGLDMTPDASDERWQ
jgi:hypothetical protein